MTKNASGKVPVTFAKGLLDDVAELTATTAEDDQATKEEAEALKRRIAELLVECKGNPFVGELMGPGLHPELANCRRVRFDIPTHKGLPRFRLIYRNEPADGAPAECPLAHRSAARRPAGPPEGTTASLRRCRLRRLRVPGSYRYIHA